MLNSRQRAQLRAMANGIDTIVHIGKDDITPAIEKQAADALKARELIKCRVLNNSMLTAREACDALCAAIGADPVQVIGTKFVIYKHNSEKRDGIVLVK